MPEKTAKFELPNGVKFEPRPHDPLCFRVYDAWGDQVAAFGNYDEACEFARARRAPAGCAEFRG